MKDTFIRRSAAVKSKFFDSTVTVTYPQQAVG